MLLVDVLDVTLERGPVESQFPADGAYLLVGRDLQHPAG
jgi:hypothetical protein